MKNKTIPIAQTLINNILQGNRITPAEGLALFLTNDLAQLSALASKRKTDQSGQFVFFNKNIHIEPTNKCIYNCLFCSYRSAEGEQGWELSMDDIITKLSNAPSDITEIHITGGVHPTTNIADAAILIAMIAQCRPNVHIKAYTATEIEQMCRISNCSIEGGLQILCNAGLSSLPGGGAEIFDPVLRDQLCPNKTSAEDWLLIHKKAHQIGIKSNATMLYGHQETYEQRIDHLTKLRQLQDETNGFNAFIPLKYKSKGNRLSHLGEVPIVEDLKMFAVARIFLDNFSHLKAYWPAIGKEKAQICLAFGADDFDGTINDSTSIYTRAGAEDTPFLSTQEICRLIVDAGWKPMERDSLYQPIIN